MSRIKLKICGVQSAKEAKQLADLGVDYLGLNFVPDSRHCITLETATAIVTAVRDSPIQIVALFRDQPIETVNDYARQLQANYVQLHGEEPADYTEQVKAPVIKAIAADPAQSADEINTFIATYPATYFVLDRQQQGHGDLVNPDLVQQIVNAHPDRIFLAGGLNPDNLPMVLAQVQPCGIDIASGVETDKQLDLTKVSQCLSILS